MVLSAIDRAAPLGREGVVEAFFGTRDRESVLGTYSIDASGDTSATTYGGYRVEDGALAFDRILTR